MGTVSAVGVYDDFAAGEASVAVRSADYKFSGRVHMKFEVTGEQLLNFSWQGLLYPWYKNFWMSSLILSCIAFSAAFSAFSVCAVG